MANLSILYLQGMGVEKNRDEAFRLMNKAYKLDSNIPFISYHLVSIYIYSHDVERNVERAISLIKKVARQGFQPAKDHLTDIKQTW